MKLRMLCWVVIPVCFCMALINFAATAEESATGPQGDVDAAKDQPPVAAAQPDQTTNANLKVELAPGIALEMVLVAEKELYVGKYEVTEQQWAALRGKIPCKWNNPTGPVTDVSWNDAQNFVIKLNDKYGEALPKGYAFRLPMEAEAEFCLRAGTTTAYSFGDDQAQLGTYAWFEGNSGGKPHAVGVKKPNPLNIYDLHGNVWEWCQDNYEQISRTPAVRGGAWNSSPDFCQSSSRVLLDLSSRCDYVGFRVVAGR